MKLPLSWLREFVAIDLTPEEVAYKLTFGGMEVEDLEYVGLAPKDGDIAGLKAQPGKHKGLAWHREKIVVAQVLEVMPHPNADRLTLLRLDDGGAGSAGKEQIVLTGAPNLFPYKGIGPLPKPLKVAYAREGSILYDGHKPGQELMTLKRAKIRGVESYSMVCSEKELGIAEDHDGIIFLDDDAPVGAPLADYLGDVVFTIKTNPNMARNLNAYGVARELAALTGQPLKRLDYGFKALGPSIEGQVTLQITNPDLNPRFTLALIKGVIIEPSSYRVQHRLRLCGVRPINNIVDATNYVMLEVGQPLHAFDYDALVERAKQVGKATPTIITRLPAPGEKLKTLDGVERTLDDYTILVCDELGVISLGGVMGGAETEVSAQTTNVLLEGAAWEFINIRRTARAQGLSSEAAYRFSRGIHPAMTVRGVSRAIEYMRQWAGGEIANGLVDEYPNPAPTVQVTITPEDVTRLLGVALTAQEIVHILKSLEFQCKIPTSSLSMPASPQLPILVTVPDHRLDIGTGVIGQADLVEEIARVYGFDRIPEQQLADELPPQRSDPSFEWEERVRDVLVTAGLQEVITYALTTPEKERRLLPTTAPDDRPYVTLLNPIVTDRVAMRHSILSSVLDVAAPNARHHDRLALFEIGAVYLRGEEGQLPEEPRRLALVLTGLRHAQFWGAAETAPMDFFDLKGVVETLLASLHIADVAYEAGTHPTYMPGRTALLKIAGEHIGWLGELHPEVRTRYDLPAQAVLAAELDLEKILRRVVERHPVTAVPEFPPVKEDLAVIVNEEVPAAKVQATLTAAGGNLLAEIRLFDVYRGPQLGAGKKSLAYGLTYQADRTLTDAEVAKVRGRIVKKLREELGAELRQ